jgi:AAA+ ATPase superfamily predicted ATPase
MKKKFLIILQSKFILYFLYRVKNIFLTTLIENHLSTSNGQKLVVLVDQVVLVRDLHGLYFTC